MNGLRNGFGTMKFNDGTKYVGDWLDNHKYGQGSLYLTNGEIFKGQWLTDQMATDGTLYSESGSVLYKGGLLNGKKHGYGKLFYSQGVYQGDWANGKRVGKGELILNDRNKFKIF